MTHFFQDFNLYLKNRAKSIHVIVFIAYLYLWSFWFAKKLSSMMLFFSVSWIYFFISFSKPYSCNSLRRRKFVDWKVRQNVETTWLTIRIMTRSANKSKYLQTHLSVPKYRQMLHIQVVEKSQVVFEISLCRIYFEFSRREKVSVYSLAF